MMACWVHKIVINSIGYEAYLLHNPGMVTNIHSMTDGLYAKQCLVSLVVSVTASR